MYQEIILPLDGSLLAEKAIPYAVELAKKFGSRITLLSVIEPVVVYSQPGVVGPVVNVAVEMDQEIVAMRDYLTKIEESLQAEGISTRKVIKQGDAATQICDYAKEVSADLIVMSTHGRSGLKRWVYGSVADKVLRGADIPVLLIRAKDETQDT